MRVTDGCKQPLAIAGSCVQDRLIYANVWCLTHAHSAVSMRRQAKSTQSYQPDGRQHHATSAEIGDSA